MCHQLLEDTVLLVEEYGVTRYKVLIRMPIRNLNRSILSALNYKHSDVSGLEVGQEVWYEAFLLLKFPFRIFVEDPRGKSSMKQKAFF